MTFVIIGAGPTGVELAGALAEIARQSLPGDFRSIDPKQSRVILVEGLPRVLPSYPEELSAKARRRLERLGVEVQTGTRVTGIDAEGVNLGGRAPASAHGDLGGGRGRLAAGPVAGRAARPRRARAGRART